MAKPKKSDDILSAGPPPAATDTEQPRPIGVPVGYIPTSPVVNPWTGRAAQGAAPRYFPGAQRTEAARLSPEDRAELQIRLKQIGLIGPKTKIRLGVWDDTSANAFEQVLAWANSTGRDWRSSLAEMEATGMNLGELGDSEGSGDAAIALSNPLDIRQESRKVAKEKLGRGKLDPKLEQQMVSGYQGLETAAQQARNGASGVGGSYTQAPSFEAFAEDTLRKNNPVAYDSHAALSAFDTIAQLMRGEA